MRGLETSPSLHEEPRPYRRGLFKVQAARDPSPARPGAERIASVLSESPPRLLVTAQY